MSNATKDTIYIDVDDEITAIIDKLQASNHKIVALVLPKRAVMLQSIVNMKLLKRTADEAKKQLVLITSDSNLLPLAGAVGVHVAKTLQSKPAIPDAPKVSSGIVAVDDDAEVDDEPELDKTKAVGALAGAPEPEETIEVDNDEPEEPKKGKKVAKMSLSKKLKVPNFDKFRLRLFLGIGGLILFIILWYIAVSVMPKATITLKADTESTTSDFSFVTKPDQPEVDTENRVLPSVVKELKKTETEKVAATGQKDVGTKASGTINVKNCEDSSTRNLPVGTTFTSGGKNYLSTAAKTVPAGLFAGGGTICNSSTVDVPVAAAENGDSYNRDAATYTSSSSALNGNFRMNGSEMTGGSSKTIKVVSQQDVDSANQKIQQRLGSNPANELVQALEGEDYLALIDTLVTGDPDTSPSIAVGEEASEVTVTTTIISTMIGVKKDDLLTFIKDSIKDQIDTARQSIIEDGLDEAIIRATDKKADGNANLTIQTIVVIGPQIDHEALKKEIAGKKRGETQKILQDQPGIREVQVDYSPFWVYSTPKKTGKINIILEQADTAKAD